MARPPQITREILSPLIRARGPISATELAALTRANRTTIARTLPDFGDELVTLGATRSTRYLLRRNIRNIGNHWQIYRLDENGRASEWAELEALHEHAWRIHWARETPDWAHHFTEENGLWSGFPFFLSDARPQGFLGRAIASRISRVLQLPEDPTQWTDEDTLVYLQSAGEDLPGNLVTGDDCLRRALARSADFPENETIAEADRPTIYPTRALEIARGLPGSSAGGEQPKFLANLRTSAGNFQSVLVKFSATMNQPTGQRWADLLLCEWVAHQILAAAGVARAGARLLDAADRRFLEVPRFDRTGPGGRTGVVSLLALSTAATGMISRSWNEAAAALHGIGLIDDSAISRIRQLQAFGELIGNTDMHFGNLAFFLGDSAPLEVTPAYDMLPMLWAPGSQGELIDRPFAPLPPLPAMTADWRIAAGWAENFWQQVTEEPRLSAEFAPRATAALETIRRLRRHVG